MTDNPDNSQVLAGIQRLEDKVENFRAAVTQKLDGLADKHGDLTARVAVVETRLEQAEELLSEHTKQVADVKLEQGKSATALKVSAALVAAVPAIIEFVLHYFHG